MNRTEVRDALYPDCPIRNILSRVGDKWSMLVLFTLETNGNLRFKELQRITEDAHGYFKDARSRWSSLPRSIPRSSTTRRIFVIEQGQEPTSPHWQSACVGNRTHG